MIGFTRSYSREARLKKRLHMHASVLAALLRRNIVFRHQNIAILHATKKGQWAMIQQVHRVCFGQDQVRFFVIFRERPTTLTTSGVFYSLL